MSDNLTTTTVGPATLPEEPKHEQAPATRPEYTEQELMLIMFTLSEID